MAFLSPPLVLTHLRGSKEEEYNQKANTNNANENWISKIIGGGNKYAKLPVSLSPSTSPLAPPPPLITPLSGPNSLALQ